MARWNLPTGLPFTVDSWDTASCTGKYHHFLTHAHTDHMAGLATFTSRFKTKDRVLYCTQTTRDLVVRHFPQLGNMTFCYLDVDGGPEILKGCNTSVRAFEANHCPGAIMLLFNVDDWGWMLHTGDVRLAEARVVRPVKAFLRRRSQPLDCLYLDCTYGNKPFDFPTKEDAVRQVCDVIAGHTGAEQQVCLACDQLGMEEVLEGVITKFGIRLWLDRSDASQSALTWWDDLTVMHPEWLTDSRRSTRFHLCDGRDLGHRATEARRRAERTGTTPPVFIRPSTQFFVHGEQGDGSTEEARAMGLLSRAGTAVRPVAARLDEFGIYRVLFSMHSSKSELARAVEILAPRHVVHFVGEVGTDLRGMIMKVTGGGTDRRWQGLMQRAPAPGREPRVCELESKDEEGSPRRVSGQEGMETPKRIPRKSWESPTAERPTELEAGLGGINGREVAEKASEGASLFDRWHTFCSEAPPSPPMSFSPSPGGEKSAEEGEQSQRNEGVVLDARDLSQAMSVGEGSNHFRLDERLSINNPEIPRGDVEAVSGADCPSGSGEGGSIPGQSQGRTDVHQGGAPRLQALLPMTHQENERGKEHLVQGGPFLRDSQEESSPRLRRMQPCASRGLRKQLSWGIEEDLANGSAKENVPPGGFEGLPPEKVSTVEVSPRARLKGGDAGSSGCANGVRRIRENASEKVGNDLPEREGGGSGKDGDLGGRNDSPEEYREFERGQPSRRGESRSDGSDSGSQSSGDEDSSGSKRKASSRQDSPARAIPKTSSTFRRFRDLGVELPPKLPHEQSGSRDWIVL